jgi:hypothetical protein
VCDLESEIEHVPADPNAVVLDMVYTKPKEDTLMDENSSISHEDSSSDSGSSENNSSEEDKDGDEGEDVWTSDSEPEDLDEDEGLDEDLDEEEDLDEDLDEDQEEEEIYGYIKDFPIQMICLEKCEGTLDQLFVKKVIDEHQAASALFQVIMILLTYQKAFKFTHNDLHTNNIMWKTTDKDYLYYKFQGKVYKVPTYGRIYKIIDFGRSIYTFQKKMFCSDSFGPGGDAATQYNCEPFFNENKPRLEPNYAFDLCRLGSSIYDFIIDEDEDPKRYDDFQKTIVRWCTDDRGKNVLYKKNGEERYPNFKLYKMIARTVHDHTPEAQLEFPFFSQF